MTLSSPEARDESLTHHPLADPFQGNQPGLDSPAFNAASVTPNDGADLANVARALYIGTAGNLKVTTKGGSEITFANVPAGILPVSVSRVWATGTAASGIIALW